MKTYLGTYPTKGEKTVLIKNCKDEMDAWNKLMHSAQVEPYEFQKKLAEDVKVVEHKIIEEDERDARFTEVKSEADKS